MQEHISHYQIRKLLQTLSILRIPYSGEDSPTDSSTDGFSNTTDSEDQQRLIRKIGNLCYSLGRKLRALFETLQRFWQKLCGIPKNIENFTLTIKNICDKINMFRDFLGASTGQSCDCSRKRSFYKAAPSCISDKNTGKAYFWKHGSFRHRQCTCRSRYDHSASQKLYFRNSCI